MPPLHRFIYLGFIFHTILQPSMCMDVKIGLILPSDLQYQWNLLEIIPAMELAVETALSRDLFPPGLKMSLQSTDSKCSETFGPLAAIDFVRYSSANVFFGPVCDYALAPVARFSPHWNIPLISAGGFVPSFDDKSEYKLLTRVHGTYSNAADAFMVIAQIFKWTQFGLIYDDRQDGSQYGGRSRCYFKMEAWFRRISSMSGEKPWHYAFDESQPGKSNFTEILTKIPKNTEVVVLCASQDTVREIMITAHDLNFDNGDFVFMHVDIFNSTNAHKRWFRADDTAERNTKARTAYDALLTLSDARPSSQEYFAFSREVKRRALMAYKNFTFDENPVNSYVVAFHDALILYALALNETLENNKPITDGAEITSRMWNRTFSGISGDITINANGDRINDFFLSDLNPDTGQFEVVGRYYGRSNQYEPINDIHLPGSHRVASPDDPGCKTDTPSCQPGPPQAPVDVSLLMCFSSWAEIAWEPGNDGGSRITGYHVEYNTQENPVFWHKAAALGENFTSHKINLQPWGDYSFRVIAQNRIGYSPPSLPTVRCATPPDRPLAGPTDVRTETHRTGKLIIRWKPIPRPLQGGPGLRYVISWRRLGNQDWYTYVDDNAEASRFETDVNDVYALYEIRVNSENALGRAMGDGFIIHGRSGEDVPTINAKDFRLDPSKPVEVDRAHFMWRAVDEDDEHLQGKINGYLLICVHQNGDERGSFIPFMSLDHEEEEIRGTVANLTANTDYNAYVIVQNTHFSGPHSRIIVFKTPKEASTQKVSVQIMNITATNQIIHLKWTGSSSLPTFSKYRIDCRRLIPGEEPKKRWKRCKHTTTTKSEATLQGLMSGTTYSVRVKVKTNGAKKPSLKSKWHEITTKDVLGISTDEANETNRAVRLPEAVRPTHYNLTFRPQIYGEDEDNFINQGTVDIIVVCFQRTDTISVHTKNLTWTKVELQNKRQKMLKIVRLNNYTDVEMIEIKVGKHLKVNQTYQLHIEFIGQITDVLKGFYYSPYKEENTTKYIFTTMMQPTDARRVFPCFDEPDFKATFQINIVRKSSLVTTSNAVLEATELLDDEFVIDKYAVSPKMSTYLVAFAIGDMDYLETTSGSIQFRTWSRKQAVHLTKFALDIGAQLLKFFENYFQIKYPMKKEDMVAVPTLIFNAMEHWGMVTYREAGMLYEEGVSSEADMEWTALLIAHELSHQWVGNLVSPRWWDDLWLNEGFATYMMFLGIDAIRPEWKMMNKYAVNYRGIQNVMSIDDVITSHPVYVPVNHPDEINEIFDLISYAKGCAAIRMMNFFLGDETFTKGLKECAFEDTDSFTQRRFYENHHKRFLTKESLTFASEKTSRFNENKIIIMLSRSMTKSTIRPRYLTEYSFATATHSNLWRVLAQQSADDGNAVIDVKSVMDTWLLEKNYPVVIVRRTSPTTITLSQMAFLLNDKERRNRSNVYWEIPFVYTHEKEKNFNKKSNDIIWLHKDGNEVYVVDKSLANASWIIGNVQQLGFYRVQYETDNWYSILQQMKTDHLVIHPINRAQIINDAWNLARAGLLEFTIALRTLDYMDREVDYVPWKAALKELNHLSRSLQLTPAYGHFKAFMRKKLENAYKKNVGTGSHYEKMQSSAITFQACRYDLDACTDAALTEFDQWISNSSHRVDPDLKFSIYCTGVRVRGHDAWDIVLQRYKETTSTSERSYLLEALSCAEEPWIIIKFLQLTITTDVFSSIDKVDVVVYISATPVGRLLAWDFVIENWDFYFEKYGTGLNLFARLVSGLTAAYNTETELNKVESFVKEHEDLGTATREFKNSIQKIKLNIVWMEKNYDEIKEWLITQTQ